MRAGIHALIWNVNYEPTREIIARKTLLVLVHYPFLRVLRAFSRSCFSVFFYIRKIRFVRGICDDEKCTLEARNGALCAIYFSDITLITLCNSNEKQGQRSA